MSFRELEVAGQKGESSNHSKRVLPASIFNQSKRCTKKLNSLAYITYLKERKPYKQAPDDDELKTIVHKFVGMAKEKNIKISLDVAVQFFESNLNDLELSFQGMLRKQRLRKK